MQLAYTAADGSVAVVIGAPRGQIERSLGKSLTDAEYREIVRSTVPAGVQSVALPDGAAHDRTFRNAWTLNGSTIECDMVKARDIHRDRLRKARAPLLAELDIEYQRADESGDNEKKRDIARRKQALRDVTADPDIEAADTPAALKLVMPRALID